MLIISVLPKFDVSPRDICPETYRIFCVAYLTISMAATQKQNNCYERKCYCCVFKHL